MRRVRDKVCLCHRDRTAADSGGFWHGSVGIAIPGFLSTFNDPGFDQAIVQAPEITSDQISALFWRNVLISVGLAAVSA